MIFHPKSGVDGALDVLIFILRHHVFGRFLDMASFVDEVSYIRNYRWTPEESPIEILYAYSETLKSKKLPAIHVVPVRAGWARLGYNDGAAPVQAKSVTNPHLMTTYMHLQSVRNLGVNLIVRTGTSVDMFNLTEWIERAMKIIAVNPYAASQDAIAMALEYDPQIRDYVAFYPRFLQLQVGDVGYATGPQNQQWIAQIGVMVAWPVEIQFEYKPVTSVQEKIINVKTQEGEQNG